VYTAFSPAVQAYVITTDDGIGWTT